MVDLIPPDSLKNLDETWARRYVGDNNDLDQFKTTWNILYWVMTEASWYDGLPPSKWENVEGLVTEHYSNLLLKHEKVTPEVRIDLVMRMNHAVHFYLACYMNGVQEKTLDEHLMTFPYDQVYKKHFTIPKKE